MSIRRVEGRSLELYLNEIGSKEALTSQEEADLARKIKRKDRNAQETLVEANLRFVVSIAKQYSNQGVALEDLISEGNVGLIRAARGFDENRGCRFITYAVWWIRQAILQTLAENSRIVRLPLNRVNELYRMGRATRELGHSLGHAPSIDEIAMKLDVPRKNIEGILSIHSTHLSLDRPVYDGSDKTFQEMIAAPGNETPENAVIEESLKSSVAELLETLDLREQTIVNLFFGLSTSRRHTLAEIGRTMGISRERVRQLKNRAIEKLFNCEESQNMLMFFN